MSFKAIVWALEQPIKRGPKFTLVCIASFANDKGWCNPGQDTLAAMCAEEEGGDDAMVAGIRTINRHVQYLVDKGIISVTKVPRADGKFDRNEYQLIAEEGAFSFVKPHAKMAHGNVTTVRQNGVPPYAKNDADRTPFWRTNLLVDPVSVDQTPSKDGVGADAPTTPAKKTRNQSVKTDAERAKAVLDQQVKQAVAAITTGLAYTKAQERWLKDDVRPFVEKYGIDDVVGWHRACTAYYSKDTPRLIKMYWATDGIPLWIARGRPTEIPNAQDAAKEQRGGTHGRRIAPSERVATDDELREAAERFNNDPRWAHLFDVSGRGVDTLSA